MPRQIVRFFRLLMPGFALVLIGLFACSANVGNRELHLLRATSKDPVAIAVRFPSAITYSRIYDKIDRLVTVSRQIELPLADGELRAAGQIKAGLKKTAPQMNVTQTFAATPLTKEFNENPGTPYRLLVMPDDLEQAKPATGPKDIRQIRDEVKNKNLLLPMDFPFDGEMVRHYLLLNGRELADTIDERYLLFVSVDSIHAKDLVQKTDVTIHVRTRLLDLKKGTLIGQWDLTDQASLENSQTGNHLLNETSLKELIAARSWTDTGIELGTQLH
jgi:hypothetical protein